MGDGPGRAREALSPRAVTALALTVGVVGGIHGIGGGFLLGTLAAAVGALYAAQSLV